MTVQAERIARETKCSQRLSILGGAGLVQTLVLGYLKSRLATCEELAQTAATLGYPVSPLLNRFQSLCLQDSGAVHLRLEQGRDSDHRTPLQTEEIEPGSLQLRDLGYFDLDVLQQIAGKEAYFISRVQDSTALFEPDGERIDLAKFLGKCKVKRLDRPILLGVGHRLPCRLVAVRVPPRQSRPVLL